MLYKVVRETSLQSLQYTIIHGSTRVLVNHLHTDKGMVTIINSYLPSEGSHDKEADYQAVLDEVYEVSRKYQPTSTIIWAGDLNGSLRRKKPSSNDKKLREFCKETGYNSPVSQQDVPTYHHFSFKCTSQIDHIMHLQSQQLILTAVHVDTNNPANTSSHDAVTGILQAHPAPRKVDKSREIVLMKGKPNWAKVDVNLYRQTTKQRLQDYIESGGLDLPNEVIVPCINHLLTTSAEACGAITTRKPCKRKTKLPWSETFKPLVRRVKEKLWLWKKAGNDPNLLFIDDYKAAKKDLRSAQRQLQAVQRKNLHHEIMDAHEGDRNTFYKLVKRQRGTNSNGLATIDFGDNTSQTEGWASYLEELATPTDNPNFSAEYKASRDLIFLLLHDQEQRSPPDAKPVGEARIARHIKTLKNKKAADVYGVTAEHLKFASTEINEVLAHITNTTLVNQKFPHQLKTGKVTPVLKKGKPAREPNSHRRITVSSMIGKVAEREMVSQTKPALKDMHSKLQFGFTEQCSAANCAFIITEALAEAKDMGQPLYLTMMDAKKAFDVVWHHSTLTQLHHEGITGSLWKAYVDMYTDIESVVCINGEQSRTISEGQGIRQGAESSTEFFKTRTNPPLRTAADIPDTLRIGTIKVGAPTCADDTCLLTTSHLGAQTALLVLQDDANRERYEFSEVKTKTLLYNSKPKLDISVLKEVSPMHLNGQPLDYTSQETHLGIERRDDGKATATVHARIKTGRRMVYALMGAGMYGLNGVSPKVSVSMLNTYVIPAVMHGLENLRLSSTDYQELATFHQKLLRNIQHLPRATAIPALYLLTGSTPLEAIHHRNVLTLYARMLRREDSVERDIIARQLAVKDMTSNSWVILVRELLCKYDLPSAFELLRSPPRKVVWKKKVKEAINTHWFSSLRKEAGRMSTLKYLNTEACTPGSVHQVWECGSSPQEVTIAATKARMLVQRYGITTSYCAGRNKTDLCPLCQQEPETLVHFLLNCPALEEARRPKLQKLIPTLEKHHVCTRSEEEVTQALLDCTAFSHIPTDEQRYIETMARRLCYDLHMERSCSTGSGSSGGPPLASKFQTQNPLASKSQTPNSQNTGYCGSSARREAAVT